MTKWWKRVIAITQNCHFVINYDNPYVDWEINKKWLIEVVDYLKTKDTNDIAFDRFTIGYCVKVFTEWILETKNINDFDDPDIIGISWF